MKGNWDIFGTVKSGLNLLFLDSWIIKQYPEKQEMGFLIAYFILSYFLMNTAHYSFTNQKCLLIPVTTISFSLDE